MESVPKKEATVTEVAVPHAHSTRSVAPLYQSQPSAGFPAPGDDQVERELDINELLVQHPSATFFVRVSGDSMEGAGIFSGDILAVDRSIEPKDGMIVVAAVNGELVVKRIRVTRGSHALTLLSENEAYEPIVVSSDEDCFVWGVVVGSVRQFLPFRHH